MAKLTNIGRAKQPLPLPDGTVLKPGQSVEVANYAEDPGWAGSEILRAWRKAGLLRVEGEKPAVAADTLATERAIPAADAASSTAGRPSRAVASEPAADATGAGGTILRG